MSHLVDSTSGDHSGDCPDCGTPIAESLHRHEHTYADPAWARCMQISLVTLSVALVVRGWSYLVRLLVDRPPSTNWIGMTAWGVHLLAFLAAVFFLTSSHASHPIASVRLVRAVRVGAVGWFLVGTVLTFSKAESGWSVAIDGTYCFFLVLRAACLVGILVLASRWACDRECSGQFISIATVGLITSVFLQLGNYVLAQSGHLDRLIDLYAGFEFLAEEFSLVIELAVVLLLMQFLLVTVGGRQGAFHKAVDTGPAGRDERWRRRLVAGMFLLKSSFLLMVILRLIPPVFHVGYHPTPNPVHYPVVLACGAVVLAAVLLITSARLPTAGGSGIAAPFERTVARWSGIVSIVGIVSIYLVAGWFPRLYVWLIWVGIGAVLVALAALISYLRWLAEWAGAAQLEVKIYGAGMWSLVVGMIWGIVIFMKFHLGIKSLMAGTSHDGRYVALWSANALMVLGIMFLSVRWVYLLTVLSEVATKVPRIDRGGDHAGLVG